MHQVHKNKNKPFGRKKHLEKATKLVEIHKKNNIEIIPYKDTRYPQKLRHISNPPSVLYSSNNININDRPLIAIVGTREPTLYGKKFVENLMPSLKKYQPIIVSGLAYGIDICAHKMALAYQIPTVAVVAGGLDMIYPYEHAKEVAKINEKGCVFSEHPLGTKPERHHFPIRNRIIAGMADVVIVVEAGAKSGALITAKYANAFNTEVFALPGNVNSTTSAGCNYLIKTHQAHMITSPEDVAYIMNWNVKTDIKSVKRISPNFPLDETEKSILKVMEIQKNPINIEEISAKTQIDMSLISGLMLQLEIKKCVEQADINQYVLS